MVREWKISLEWMLDGGNCSQSLCQHHLFSMGHCGEVVLAQRERCLLSHTTAARDPRGSHAQRHLVLYERSWNSAYRGQLGTDHYSRHDSKKTGKLCSFSSFSKKSNKFSSEAQQKAKSQHPPPWP